jgi:hypothetical protein
MSQAPGSEDELTASHHHDDNIGSSSQARSRLKTAQRTDEQIRELEINADEDAAERREISEKVEVSEAHMVEVKA